MSTWERSSEIIKARFIKTSRERGECVLLREVEERYFNDPMSEYAPSECVGVVTKNHKKSCEICQALIKEKK